MTNSINTDVATLTKNTDVSGLAKQFEQVSITPKTSVTPRPSVGAPTTGRVSDTARLIQQHFRSSSSGAHPSTSMPNRRASDANPPQQNSSRSTSDERTNTVIPKPQVPTRPIVTPTANQRHFSFSAGELPKTSLTNASLAVTPSNLQANRNAQPPRQNIHLVNSPLSVPDETTNTRNFARNGRVISAFDAHARNASVVLISPASSSPASIPSLSPLSPRSSSSDETGPTRPKPPRPPKPPHIKLSPSNNITDLSPDSTAEKTNTIIHHASESLLNPTHKRTNSGSNSKPPQIIVSLATATRRNSMPIIPTNLRLRPSPVQETLADQSPYGPNLHQGPTTSSGSSTFSARSAASICSNISVISNNSDDWITGSGSGSGKKILARGKKTTPEERLDQNHKMKKSEILEKTTRQMLRLRNESVGSFTGQRTQEIEQGYVWEQTKLMEELIHDYSLPQDLEIILAAMTEELLKLPLPDEVKEALLPKTKTKAQLTEFYKDHPKKLQVALLQKARTIDDIIRLFESPLSDDLQNMLMKTRTEILNKFIKNKLPEDLVSVLASAKEEIDKKRKESFKTLKKTVATQYSHAKRTIKHDGTLKKRVEKLETEKQRLEILRKRSAELRAQLLTTTTDKNNALRNYDAQLQNVSDSTIRRTILSKRETAESTFEIPIRKIKDELMHTDEAIKTLDAKIKSESASMNSVSIYVLPQE